MTNLQKFFSSSPGVIFIFVLLVCELSSEDLWPFLQKVAMPLISGDRAQLLSLIALVFLVLGFASVACTLIVGRVWDLLFYFLGHGYDRVEYEAAREALLSRVEVESSSQVFLSKLKIQPIYGTILHSYAPTSYVEWLGRRWTSFNNSGLQATAAVMASITSISISVYYEIEWSPWWIILFFGAIFPLITLYIGAARLREVLSSEELFCRSLLDPELNSALTEVSEVIAKRGGSTDGVPDLDGRL